MYKQSLLSASIVLALSSTSAFAEDYALFDEVVVSASRSEQQLEDVAASVSVVTSEQMEKNLASDIGDALRYVPGVDVNTDSRMGIQDINIRGMEGNRVNILVDGVTQPYLYDQAYKFISSNRVTIDLDMVKSVEVVKGSASSLYGSDGIGGIVAFQTKDPSDFMSSSDTYGGQVKLGYSSKDDTFSENVVLANRFGDLETMIAYTRKDFSELNNFQDNSGDLPDFAPLDTDGSNDNVLAKLQYQINQEHRIEFTGEYIDETSDSDLYHSTDQNVRSSDLTERRRISAKHIWDGATLIADTVTTQVSWMSHSQENNTNRLKSGTNELKDYTYSEEGYQLEVQADKLTYIGDTEHLLTYGLSASSKEFYNRNLTRNLDTGDESLYFYQPDADEYRYGVFLQDDFTIGKLSLTPSVRFDSFKTKADIATPETPDLAYKESTNSALTARLGAVYAVTDETKVYGQVSQGFRAPNFEELYYSMDGGVYAILPNADLEAEESITYETGVRYNDEKVALSFGVFYTDYDNFIELTSFEHPDYMYGVYQNVNINSAYTKGVELSGTLALDNALRGLSTSFAATYTEGEGTDGDGVKSPLNSINPWNVVTSLDFNSPNEKWGSSLKLNYIAEKRTSDISDPNDSGYVGTPDATIVDVTAFYKPMKDLTLTAGVFNITDKEYWAWSDINGKTKLYSSETQAERNWAVTAKYEF